MKPLYSKENDFLSMNHQYKGLTILSLLPFILNTLFVLVLVLATGMDSFTWYITIPILISLWMSGVGFPSSNKKWNTAAWISTLMLTISSIVIGYYDYFQWATTKLCFGLFIFYIIIFMMKRFLDHKTKL